MKKRKLILIFLTFLCFGFHQGYAKLSVVVSYPYIADLAEKIGGDRVNVTSLAQGYKDPHYVTPRPSFIAKMRMADLLIINGGQLEIGWIPPIIGKANNPRINPGSRGFLDLFGFIEACDVPKDISRAQGDVHPDGNPHFHLDPGNILIVSKVIRDKMTELDPAGKEGFTKRFDEFEILWKKKMSEWKDAMKPFSGKNLVQYHKNFCYFIAWAGLEKIGTLEPVPGIPPTTKHILEMIDTINLRGAAFIFHDVYHMLKPSRFVSRKTGVRLVILPHDVGALSGVTDVESLFDEIVRRLKND